MPNQNIKHNGCASCSLKWLGNKDKKVNFADWHCRKYASAKRHELPVIGDDAALKRAKGCSEWQK